MLSTLLCVQLGRGRTTSELTFYLAISHTPGVDGVDGVDGDDGIVVQWSVDLPDLGSILQTRAHQPSIIDAYL